MTKGWPMEQAATTPEQGRVSSQIQVPVQPGPFMLHFRNGPPVRNYLARREQVRLLVLVMFLMTVVWIAIEARNPAHYRWIWDRGRGDATVGEEVDTRLRASFSEADDTFVFPRPGESLDEGAQAMAGPLTEADLASVRDDEPFRSGEQVAWFKLFGQLQAADASTLREESTGTATFIQLYRQPREYRGELVTLAGTLRRSEEVPATSNSLGIESYYRTWLFPRDNPSNPIVVYTLTVPDGFPEGMTLAEQVELEGYFFKRWPYAASDTVRSAPVVLAKSLRWIVPEPAEAAPPMSATTMVMLAAAMAFCVALFVWWQTRNRKHVEQPVSDLFAKPPQGHEPDEQTNHLRVVANPEHGSEN